MQQDGSPPEGNVQANYDWFFLRHLQSVAGKNGRYINHRFIGKGGNGTTFFVTCTTGRYKGLQFALKVFHKISSEIRKNAFFDEIDNLKRLNHPSILNVIDEGEYSAGERSYPFAIMDYVPFNARKILWRKENSQLLACRIVLNCLSALNFIHKQKEPIVHRDIKPDNILISDGVAKLGDFGLAKRLSRLEDEAQTESSESKPMELLTQLPGMPRYYRVPEIIDRIKAIQKQRTPIPVLTTKCDIYQLGTVFYELLTNYNPQQPPASNILEPIELDLRPIPGIFGDALNRLIEKMLTDNHYDRPDAEACLDELDNIHKDMCRKLADVSGDDI